MGNEFNWECAKQLTLEFFWVFGGVTGCYENMGVFDKGSEGSL